MNFLLKHALVLCYSH